MIKMFGPHFDGSGKLVNRDVTEADEQAYVSAGYKRGEVPATANTETVEVKKTDSIPESFPGHAPLLEAGISTFAELDAVEDITEIPGIGAATAEKIKAARTPSNQ